MPTLSDLGFGASGLAHTVFRERRPLKLTPRTTAPLTVAYSSLNQDTSRVFLMDLDLAATGPYAHVDWSSHVFSFCLRVPNASWWRPDGSPLPAARMAITAEEATQLVLPAALGARPIILHAHRLFRRIRLLGAEGGTLDDLESANIVSELRMWLNEKMPEPTRESVPVTAERTDGVNMCVTGDEVARLYSVQGLRVHMKLPLASVASGAAFFPFQSKLTLEFTMEDAVTAFQLEGYPAQAGSVAAYVSCDQFGATPIYDRDRLESRVIAYAGHEAALEGDQHARMHQVPDRRLAYDIVDASVSVDSVELHAEGERALLAAIDSPDGVVTLFTRYVTEKTQPFSTLTTDLLLALTTPLARVSRAFALFHHTTQSADLHFDSFTMRNPAITRAQWRVGDLYMPREPLASHASFYDTLRDAPRGVRGAVGRITKHAFHGDSSYVFDAEIDYPYDRCGLVSYTPARCFMLHQSFLHDGAAGAVATTSGRSITLDRPLQLRVQRSAATVRATDIVIEGATQVLRADAGGSAEDQLSRDYDWGFRRFSGVFAFDPLSSLGYAPLASATVRVPDVSSMPTCAIYCHPYVDGIEARVYRRTPFTYADMGDDVHALQNLRTRFCCYVYNYFAPLEGLPAADVAPGDPMHPMCPIFTGGRHPHCPLACGVYQPNPPPGSRSTLKTAEAIRPFSRDGTTFDLAAARQPPNPRGVEFSAVTTPSFAARLRTYATAAGPPSRPHIAPLPLLGTVTGGSVLPPLAPFSYAIPRAEDGWVGYIIAETTQAVRWLRGGLSEAYG